MLLDAIFFGVTGEKIQLQLLPVEPYLDHVHTLRGWKSFLKDGTGLAGDWSLTFEGFGRCFIYVGF